LTSNKFRGTVRGSNERMEGYQMIVTFGKELPAVKNGDLAGVVAAIVDRVSVDLYRLTWESDSPIGNLYASIT